MYRFLLIACLLLLGSPGKAQEPKNVLVLYGNNAELPWVKIFDASLRAAAIAGTKHPIEFFTEYFDVARFPGARHHEAFAEFVRARYSDRKIELVVSGGSTTFDFLLTRRQTFLAGVPLVYSFLPPDKVSGQNLPDDITGVIADFNPLLTIELALRLHPGTSRLVMVTGAGPWGRAWEKRLRQETSVLQDRVELEFLSGLPTPQLLQRLSTLPKGTVVFTPGYFHDGADSVFAPREALQTMAAKSAVPVYAAYETMVGTGIVGGVIPTFDAIGRQTGEIVARILDGKAPATLGPHVLQGDPLIDWRQ
ncbi:MAG: histidine kinase, partial [Candidatus Binatia bacterium]